jgi:hypothetical protein
MFVRADALAIFIDNLGKRGRLLLLPRTVADWQQSSNKSSTTLGQTSRPK